MSLLNGAAAKLSQYNRDAVLSASPARLLTMLYDRLVLDLKRAHGALTEQNWSVAWESLRHADQIVAELASSLKLDAWDGADGLLQLYTYLTETIVTANIDRDVDRVREAIELVEPLRQAWHEAAAQLPAAGAFVGATSGRGIAAYGGSSAELGVERDLGVA